MQVPVKFKLKNLHEVNRINENEPGLKTDRYFEKSRDGKLILRSVMRRYIAQQITGRHSLQNLER